MLVWRNRNLESLVPNVFFCEMTISLSMLLLTHCASEETEAGGGVKSG